MTAARRIAQHRPPRAGPACVARVRHARMRALGPALLGAATGLALAVAILVAAPAVGGAPAADDARFDRPAVPLQGWAPVSVASVIVPARGVAAWSGRDREEGSP